VVTLWSGWIAQLDHIDLAWRTIFSPFQILPHFSGDVKRSPRFPAEFLFFTFKDSSQSLNPQTEFLLQDALIPQRGRKVYRV